MTDTPGVLSDAQIKALWEDLDSVAASVNPLADPGRWRDGVNARMYRFVEKRWGKDKAKAIIEELKKEVWGQFAIGVKEGDIFKFVEWYVPARIEEADKEQEAQMQTMQEESRLFQLKMAKQREEAARPTPIAGKVRHIRLANGRAVLNGDVSVVIQPEDEAMKWLAALGLAQLSVDGTIVDWHVTSIKQNYRTTVTKIRNNKTGVEMPNPTIKDQSVEDLVAALDAPIEETEAPHMTLDEFKQECLDLMQKSGYTKGETPSVISAAFDGKKADVVYQADGPDKGLEILKEYLAKNPKKAVSIAGPVAVAKPQAKPDDTYELTPSEIRKRYTVKVGPKDAPEATKKSYLKAAGRVLLFRYAHPMGRIDTELVKSEPDATIFKATVITEDGLVLAIAHSMISKDQAKQARGKHLEMAETTAIARALFLAGFGTDQPALEFDEGDELADSPVERK